MAEIHYQIRAHAQLSEATYATLQAMDQDLFADHPFGLHYEWAPIGYHVLAYDGEQIVGHADLTERVADFGGRDTWVVGIGGVMTAREYRGQGISSAILDRCEAFIVGPLQADYGMLFCAPDIVPFYARRGWLLVESPVTVEQPGQRFVWPYLTMLWPCPGLRWEETPINIRGLPW
jgi:GNAT superfamily N-acetyltransferase